jgi:hypothetical protein
MLAEGVIFLSLPMMANKIIYFDNSRIVRDTLNLPCN